MARTPKKTQTGARSFISSTSCQKNGIQEARLAGLLDDRKIAEIAKNFVWGSCPLGYACKPPTVTFEYAGIRHHKARQQTRQACNTITCAMCIFQLIRKVYIHIMHIYMSRAITLTLRKSAQLSKPMKYAYCSHASWLNSMRKRAYMQTTSMWPAGKANHHQTN